MKLKIRKFKSKARLISNRRNDRYKSISSLKIKAKYSRISL